MTNEENNEASGGDDNVMTSVPEVPERLTRIEAVIMLGDARDYVKAKAEAEALQAQAESAAQN